MQIVQLALAERSYPIYIGTGLLAQAELLLRHLPHARAAVITDDVVAPLYLDPLARTLTAAGIEVAKIIIPAGEDHKDWRTLNQVFDALLSAHCERKTTLIALGGGVVGDLAGFAAATYLRGVPLIQAPTTLLAQVDSSVGGKTAINHPLGKNMIGAFYQPRAVIIDTATLNTLPPREIAAGLAEIIKYGLIRDRDFFGWLEQNIDALNARDPHALVHAIQRSCANKAAVVAADEREERGQRALLNLGHTFGHAIETGLGYGRWLHGEAVAAGMVVAARVSEQLGLLGRADVGRIVALLKRAHLPTIAPDLGGERYLQLMGLDKKVEAGRIRFVLLRGIGAAFLTTDVAPAVITTALAASVGDHA
ncbi:MAG TPA: 3-dehydroquinate synthase [Burkholderiales bacterium]|nr:3-dehydroquinate synthase [Burkholderiales bacterium]